MNSKEKLDYILREALNLLGYTVITDENGKILMLDKNYACFLGVDPIESIGKYITEIVPTSEIPRVLSSKKKEQGNIFILKDGTPIVNSRIPVFRENQFIGVISTTILNSLSQIELLHKQIETLTHEKDLYRKKCKELKASLGAYGKIIGVSQQIEKIKQTIKQMAAFDFPVLITGETGVGKELFASAIHENSSRQGGPFVKINCAAIPGELLESELFGYEGGAFSGALRQGKKGKFEIADHGTILLDEIGEMSMALQTKLLRVLQEQEVEPVGATHPKKIDVRIICSTNCNIEESIQTGKFRSDLYYRINTIEISVPPLRERPEDIRPLCDFFLQQINLKQGIDVAGLSPSAEKFLMAYAWPGNVRELMHCIERACIERPLGQLEAEDFKFKPAIQLQRSNYQQTQIKELRKKTEKEAMIRALEICKGNRTKAAEMIGMSRAVFFRRMKTYQIT